MVEWKYIPSLYFKHQQKQNLEKWLNMSLGTETSDAQLHTAHFKQVIKKEGKSPKGVIYETKYSWLFRIHYHVLSELRRNLRYSKSTDWSLRREEPFSTREKTIKAL